MKNLLKLSVIGCSLILFVGCGNKKTLKCSLTDNSDIVKGKNIIEAVFKEDEIVKITLGVESTFDEDYVSYMDSMVDAFDDEYEELSKKKGVSYKTTKKDKTINMILSADLTKMDEETKTEFNFIGNSESYKEAKKQLEDEGYTCK